MSLSVETPEESEIVESLTRDFSSIFTILPNGDNDNEAMLEEAQNNFDMPIENGSSKII